VKGFSVAAENETPTTTARRAGALEQAAAKGHLPVSELVADRAAAPSPFGDDQTFPLPTTQLTYLPATHW
jgi:hypothetical protein